MGNGRQREVPARGFSFDSQRLDEPAVRPVPFSPGRLPQFDRVALGIGDAGEAPGLGRVPFVGTGLDGDAGGLLVTGPTGTNVNDFRAIIVR